MLITYLLLSFLAILYVTIRSISLAGRGKHDVPKCSVCGRFHVVAVFLKQNVSRFVFVFNKLTAWIPGVANPAVVLAFCFCRCGSKRNCTVSVDSELFGNPCPGTSKYIEAQYICTG